MVMVGQSVEKNNAFFLISPTFVRAKPEGRISAPDLGSSSGIEISSFSWESCNSLSYMKVAIIKCTRIFKFLTVVLSMFELCLSIKVCKGCEVRLKNSGRRFQILPFSLKNRLNHDWKLFSLRQFTGYHIDFLGYFVHKAKAISHNCNPFVTNDVAKSPRLRSFNFEPSKFFFFFLIDRM